MNTALKLAIINSRHRSQIVVAGRIGISEPRLSKIVRGHIEPTTDEKKALARELRVPQTQLFPDSQTEAGA